MVELTVGYVAGFIAAAVFVARLLGPNILVFVLSSILPERNSAATWTVASRALQQSHWPDILRSDSVKNSGVRKDVALVTKLMFLFGILTTIAGIVTPLGLYEALITTKNVEAPFRYLKDSSPFGYGTPPPSNLPLTRKCGSWVLIPCPFTDSVIVAVEDSEGHQNFTFPYGYDLRVPEIYTEIFSSGVNNQTTISNYFDIRWRQYMQTSDPDYNNGSAFLISSFRAISSIVLNNATETVEGLIVDTVNGGIGLRNHTAPTGYDFGATWEEDILFIEPETVCVDTNTTVDYSIAINPNSSTSVVDVVIVDHGGFVNINHTYPEANLSDTQKNPDLYGRAYKAAWMTNAWTMFYLNITNIANHTTHTSAFSFLNSKIGQTFSLPEYSFPGMYNSLTMDSGFSTHLNIGGQVGNSTSPGSTGTSTSNPNGLTTSNFSDIGFLCSGAEGADPANINNIFVNCGLMRGVPQRKSPGSSFLFDGGSKWSQPLYACATTAKATIKTVSFTHNGTDDLQSLKVTQVRNKEYADEKSKPLWGVENTGDEYTQAEIDLIWGLISEEYANHPNVSSVRQDSLYLSGYKGLSNGIEDDINFDYMPASRFFVSALVSAYEVGAGKGLGITLDYSGQTNMAMWARWQNFSSSPSTAALIPNLIFTDYAAAGVIGTKGVLGPENTAPNNLVSILITPTIKKIRYHYLFAIPAFIVLLFLVVFVTIALVALIFGHHSITNLKMHLQQTSPGRIFTTFLYPHPGAMRLRSKDWSKHMGKQLVDLSGDFPTGDQELKPSEKEAKAIPYEDPANARSNEEFLSPGLR